MNVSIKSTNAANAKGVKKFMRYLSNQHLNFLNVAVYDVGSNRRMLLVEHVVNCRQLGKPVFIDADNLRALISVSDLASFFAAAGVKGY